MKKRRTAGAVLVLFLAIRLGFGCGETLGDATREDILVAHPDWHEVVAAYQPDPSDIERLRAVRVPVTIRVYLGTWCPDSKAHVSEFFKVLDAADNPLIAASYIGIPRERNLRAPYYRGQDIERLPTFLVFVDGEERGRIIEVPSVSIERDLADILER